MQLLDFVADNQLTVMQLTAGENITFRDAVEISPTGEAYPTQCTDYSSIGNMGTAIVAATTVFAGIDIQYHRKSAVVSPSTGYIYVTAPNSGNNGLIIYQYSPSGALMGSVAVHTAAVSAVDPSMVVLSNGNVAVVFSDMTDHKYAVYDAYLNQIVAATTIEASRSGQAHVAVGLSGGGFMLVWQSGVDTTKSKLAVYSNTGSVVTGLTTIATWTGTEGIVQQRAVQLDNGNVAIAFNSAFTTTVGTYIAIVTAAGASVLATTSTGDTGVISSGNSPPEIAAGVGYFAIAAWNAGSTKAVARIYSNAGVLQGSAFQDSDGIGLGVFVGKLLWDGSNFWYANPNVTSSTKINLTKIPISGTNYVTYGVGSISGAGHSVDGFYERNRITLVYTADGATGTQKFCVFNTNTLIQEIVSQTTGITVDSTCRPRAVPVGDFAFLLAYITSTTTNFLVMKYSDSAIAGVCAATSAKDALCSIWIQTGVYSVNAVKGATGKKFDFSSTNIYGNKGAIMTNAITLKGLQ